jgi:hypothetical protein
MLVLCKLNFCHFGCVKAAEIADRKLIRIHAIRINLRSAISAALTQPKWQKLSLQSTGKIYLL